MVAIVLFVVAAVADATALMLAMYYQLAEDINSVVIDRSRRRKRNRIILPRGTSTILGGDKPTECGVFLLGGFHSECLSVAVLPRGRSWCGDFVWRRCRSEGTIRLLVTSTLLLLLSRCLCVRG